MQPYRVSRRESDDTFYVLAKSPAEAIEKVTLQIADLEGVAAWTANPAMLPVPLTGGRVVDRDGEPIKTMMA